MVIMVYLSMLNLTAQGSSFSLPIELITRAFWRCYLEPFCGGEVSWGQKGGILQRADDCEAPDWAGCEGLQVKDKSKRLGLDLLQMLELGAE